MTNFKECGTARLVLLTSLAMAIGAIYSATFAHQTSAFGQDLSKHTSIDEPASSKKIMTDAKGKKIQVVDFDDANIEGKAKAPDGFVLQSRQGSNFKNIMKLRRNFRNQIESSSYEALVAAPTAQ